jgi:hypothetical protein
MEVQELAEDGQKRHCRQDRSLVLQPGASGV